MYLNIELLEQSFEKLKPCADEFTASFYENLFAANPQIKLLFANTDMAIQRKKLFNVLVLIVESFRNSEALEPVIKTLGARHVGYGVVPKYYPALGKVLLVTLKQYLQQDWTPEVKQAWVAAFKAISAVMLKGAGVDYIPKEVELETNEISKKQPVPAPATQNGHQLEQVTEEKPEQLPVKLQEKTVAQIKLPAAEFVALTYEKSLAIEPEAEPLTKKQPELTDAERTRQQLEEVIEQESEALPVEILEKTFALIKPRASEFVASFYENLFAAHPEIKPLFGSTDMEIQRKKLLNTLVLVVESLRNPEVLTPVLSSLGARHVGYGAIPKYYGPIAQALLMTFEQYLQQDWTPEVKRAWAAAFKAISAVMLKGAGVNYIPKEPKAEPLTKKQPELTDAERTRQQLEEVIEQESEALPVEILEKTFALIKPRADEFVASFYENLFAAHPEIKPLFGSTDMEIQRKKLLNTLVLVVEGLRNPEVLTPVLSALGARHVGYGAIPKYYGSVVKALLMTFEQYLQQDWTPEVKRAWVAAFKSITAVMLKGTSEVSSPTVVQDQKAPTIKKPSQPKPEIKIESQQLQPQVEQSKKLQQSGEILKEHTAKITSNAGQLVANIKKIPARIIDTFWELPPWSIALFATVIMCLIFVFEDENSALGKILGGTDAISLVVAVVLFIKEAPDRKKQYHYQAWSIIDGAAGLKVSYARLLAMQDLNKDGVSLRELNAPGAELDDINLPGANLSEANFSEADMSNGNLSKANLSNANLSKTKLSAANLTHANLSFARLSGANLSSANLSEANLICADLSNANMSGANLKNASLSGANLNGALLIGANLKGAKVSSYDFNGAVLENAIMPDGSKYKSEQH